MPAFLNHISLNQFAMDFDKVDRESYPFFLPAVKNMGTLDLSARVTLFVGENGSGKSTLVEAIAIAAGFNAEGGTKNFNFRTRPSESPLHDYVRLSRSGMREGDGFFLRAESFYNVATEIDRLEVAHSYGGVSLHELSHGESFLALVKNRFLGEGLYILDEPEAALSPQGQITLVALLLRLAKQESSQIIIATHSPIVMAFPDAVIYEISEGGIERTKLEETTHYRLYRGFFANPNAFFAPLLRDLGI